MRWYILDYLLNTTMNLWHTKILWIQEGWTFNNLFNTNYKGNFLQPFSTVQNSAKKYPKVKVKKHVGLQWSLKGSYTASLLNSQWRPSSICKWSQVINQSGQKKRSIERESFSLYSIYIYDLSTKSIGSPPKCHAWTALWLRRRISWLAAGHRPGSYSPPCNQFMSWKITVKNTTELASVFYQFSRLRNLAIIQQKNTFWK